PRTLRCGLLTRSAGTFASAEDEEIHELSGRGRRANRTVPPSNPARDDEGRFLPRLRRLSEPRPADVVGADSNRVASDGSFARTDVRRLIPGGSGVKSEPRGPGS